jgi:hypothetical protein
MRLAPACALAVLSAAIAVPHTAGAQTLPSVLRQTKPPARAAEQAPPVPTVMRPAEGEVVAGDLVVAVQVPPNVPARRYTIEAGYWDPARNDWAYPGTLGDDFSGGTTATTRIAADLRMKYNQKATRWRIHVRATDPPGGWGPWREFTWQSAPSVDRTAPTATTKPEPTPAATPTNTANPATGETGKPGMMVPGATPPPAGQPPTGAQPTVPNPGPPDTRTAPPTPPGTSVPAVQQPPATSVPAVQQPPATTVPSVQNPPATSAPQVPRQLPAVPSLPFRLPSSLPKIRSGSAAPPSAEARPAQPQSARTKPEGEQRPVSMTKLAVWDGKPMPAANQRVYVRGPVDVDWAGKSLRWWFRGMTTAPGAVPGKWRWEMSRAPFAGYGPWQATPGIGYAGSADGVQFVLDLNAYAPRPPGWPVAVSAASQPQPGAGASVAGSLVDTQAPTFSNRSGIPPDLLDAPSGSRGELTTPLPDLPASIQVSLSLFVRVVPLDAAGNDVDLPSNFVELRFGPAEKPTPFDPNPKRWPVVSYVAYRPVQGYAFDWQCWVKASMDIKAPVFLDVGIDPGTKDSNAVLFKKGTTRNVCGNDDGNIVDEFVDAMGGFIEMMGKVVDWVSKTYANLKAEVASTICGDNAACKIAVQAGLNAGLAALGVPPDLPDFDQLQAMGEGYLLDAVAQQVAAKTGSELAGTVAKEALQEFIAKGKAAAQGGNGGGGAWVPDDSKQYKPLLLTLAVSNPSAAGATPAMYLEVSEPGGKRYLPRTVAVPSLLPKQLVNVSVALDPVSDPKAWMELLPTQADYLKAYPPMDSSGGWAGGLSSDPNKTLIATKTAQAEAALKAWRTAYLTGSVPLQAALKQPPFVYKVACKTSCMADKPACLVQ